MPFAALFAPGNLDFAFALVSFSPSVFVCCLWSTSYFRDACFAWFNSGYMLYERLVANFTYFLRAVHSDPWRFLSIPQNGEVCTVGASSCSVSSRGSHFESGHYLDELSMVAMMGFPRILRHFSRSSGCPGVERQFFELSSAHNCECSRAPVGLPVHDYGAVDIHTLIDSSEQP